MKWFGPTWHAPICTPGNQTTTPEAPCVVCDEDFGPHDQGVTMPHNGMSPSEPSESAMHLACFAHVLGLESEGPEILLAPEPELERALAELEEQHPAVKKAREELDRVTYEIAGRKFDN